MKSWGQLASHVPGVKILLKQNRFDGSHTQISTIQPYFNSTWAIRNSNHLLFLGPHGGNGEKDNIKNYLTLQENYTNASQT